MPYNRKIKALWLVNWYPHPGHPILGNFTQREAEAATGAGTEICVVTAISIEDDNTRIEEQMSENGILEIRVYYSARSFFLKPIVGLYAFLRGIRYAEKIGFSPDLIHLHVMSSIGILALYYKWRHGCPLFFSEHWSGFSAEKISIPYWRKWLGKIVARHSKAIFVVSKNMEHAMKKIGWAGNYIVQPNVVNCDLFWPDMSNKNSMPFHFVHVSSLNNGQKNIHGMVRAVQLLAKETDEFLVTMIGGDDGTEELEQWIVEYGVKKYFRILGRKPILLIAKEFRKSDAFILFSNREGLPCVILEAMASGLPIISSDIPSIEEWVNEDTGIIVSRKNEKELAEAMQYMVKNISDFRKEKIRKPIVEKCDYKIIGKKIIAQYQGVLAAEKISS